MTPSQNWIKHLAREAIRYLAGSAQSRLRQHEALRDLEERLLTDIGISRDQARHSRLGITASRWPIVSRHRRRKFVG